MTSAALSPTVDARTLEPRLRDAHILSSFAALEEGQGIELVDDHDLGPLYARFQAQWPDRFAWNALEEGPAVWRVAITRVPAFDAHGRGRRGGGGWTAPGPHPRPARAVHRATGSA